MLIFHSGQGVKVIVLGLNRSRKKQNEKKQDFGLHACITNWLTQKLLPQKNGLPKGGPFFTVSSVQGFDRCVYRVSEIVRFAESPPH